MKEICEIRAIFADSLDRMVHQSSVEDPIRIQLLVGPAEQHFGSPDLAWNQNL